MPVPPVRKIFRVVLPQKRAHEWRALVALCARLLLVPLLGRSYLRHRNSHSVGHAAEVMATLPARAPRIQKAWQVQILSANYRRVVCKTQKLSSPSHKYTHVSSECRRTRAGTRAQHAASTDLLGARKCRGTACRVLRHSPSKKGGAGLRPAAATSGRRSSRSSTWLLNIRNRIYETDYQARESLASS